MFTGIVQAYCPVLAVQDKPGLRGLTIDLAEHAADLALGASVAVNGVCLTVTAVQAPRVEFDVIRETLDLSNLGGLKAGDYVNIERSFKVGDEIGGHIVSGHVTGTCEVVRIEAAGNERLVYLRIQPGWLKYLHYKGFAAFDGASLTIASVSDNALEIGVALIPETIARTTLGRVAVGDRVNLEVDSQTQAVVETVERLMASPDWQQRFKQLM